MIASRRARPFAAAALAAGSVACATAKTAYDVPLDDPGPMAQNWRFPDRIIEGHTGSVIDEQDLERVLRDARVVYVAERHNRPPDHAIQLRVFAALFAQEPELALGIEMLPRSKQAMVDAYVRGDLDEAGFLSHVNWKDTWGFDFALYRPLFEFAKVHGLPIIALNARKEITRNVAKNGLEGLEPELAAELPELDLDDEAHRAYIRDAFGLTDDDGEEVHPGFVFENFYEAQVIWDETMAHEVAETVTATTGARRMVVIAGSGHIEYRFGIPNRAARRGAEPFVTILPVVYDELEGPLEELIEGSIADLIWLISPEDRLPEPASHARGARAEVP